MELLCFLLSMGILGMASSYLIIFLDFCLNQGNIFDWYYLFLLRKVEPNHPKWAKVLGMCPICFGFWISTALFILYEYKLNCGYMAYFLYIGVCQFHLIKRFTT